MNLKFPDWERSQKKIDQLQSAGVRFYQPGSCVVAEKVQIKSGTAILPNCRILGKTTIGKNCQIGPDCLIDNCQIGDDCQIVASCLEEAVIESSVDIGPYSHIREGTVIKKSAHIGNFVETKNTEIGQSTRVGHMSYLGDATVGQDVNVGAGAVVANFDGQKKYQTKIGSGTQVGSDTILVAPVSVGRNAKTGAGAVVIEDIPDDALAVGVPAKVIKVRGVRIK
ncbi:hypothetical protein HY388_01980 [Candidatus Daviesbacteria bacterium]|nr:hypothetical protein [Candidatus Daviesbacteria bacterium]